MKTEEEIKKQIQKIQSSRSVAKSKDDDAGVRAWSKAEKWLKWVLDEELKKQEDT